MVLENSQRSGGGFGHFIYRVQLYPCLGVGGHNPAGVVGVSLDPSEVDVGGGDGEVTVTARVTDDLSGVDQVRLRFVSAILRQEAVAYAEAELFGWITDGEYVGKLIVPRFSEAGTWRLEGVDLYDYVGNRREYGPDELARLGLSIPIEVTTMEET